MDVTALTSKAQFVYSAAIHHISFFNFTPGRCTKDNWGLYIILTWVPKFSKAYQRSVTLLNLNIHHWGLDLRLKLQVVHKEQKRFNIFVSLTVQNTELSSFLALFKSWSCQAFLRSSLTFFSKSCIQSIRFNFCLIAVRRGWKCHFNVFLCVYSLQNYHLLLFRLKNEFMLSHYPAAWGAEDQQVHCCCGDVLFEFN